MSFELLNSGLSGLRTGTASMLQSGANIAQNVVRAPESGNAASATNSPQTSQGAEQPQDLASDVVNLQRSLHQVQAASQVVQRADEVLGALLDERV